MKELVSVVIPTYKRSKGLSRAINSVLKQTYKNIEIIVVDDNGDNSKYQKETQKMMEKYSSDNRVKYIKHKINRKGSAARNTGIKLSNGNYIAFLDDDDYYLENRIENCVKGLLKNPEYLGVLSNYELHQNGNLFRKGCIKKENINLKALLMNKLNIGTGSNLFFKREIIVKLNGFNEEFKRHQDLEMLGRVMREGELLHINKILVIKEQESYSVRADLETIIETKKKYLNLFKNNIQKFSNVEQEKIYFEHTFDLFKLSLRSKRYLKMFHYLIFCIKTPILFLKRFN